MKRREKTFLAQDLYVFCCFFVCVCVCRKSQEPINQNKTTSTLFCIYYLQHMLYIFTLMLCTFSQLSYLLNILPLVPGYNTQTSRKKKCKERRNRLMVKLVIQLTRIHGAFKLQCGKWPPS